MEVYTDGACSGNPGPGGWGWVSADGRTGSGGSSHTTNQRMEVQAVAEALTAVAGPVEIHSDSTYVVNCFNDQWYEGWLKRGWKNSQKKPVANQDLWEPLIAQVLDRGEQVTFTWVKGHSGNTQNEIADQLAVAAREVEKEKLAADSTLSAGAEQACVPWPKDSAVWVVGDTTIDQDQSAALDLAMAGVLRSDSVVVISGLRRGSELRGAELALAAGRQLGAVLPFETPAAGWPEAKRERFDAVLAQATWCVTLSSDRTLPGKAIEARNQWIADTVLAAVVVGSDDLADWLDDRGVSVIRP